MDSIYIFDIDRIYWINYIPDSLMKSSIRNPLRGTIVVYRSKLGNPDLKKGRRRLSAGRRMVFSRFLPETGKNPVNPVNPVRIKLK